MRFREKTTVITIGVLLIAKSISAQGNDHVEPIACDSFDNFNQELSLFENTEAVIFRVLYDDEKVPTPSEKVKESIKHFGERSKKQEFYLEVNLVNDPSNKFSSEIGRFDYYFDNKAHLETGTERIEWVTSIRFKIMIRIQGACRIRYRIRRGAPVEVTQRPLDCKPEAPDSSTKYPLLANFTFKATTIRSFRNDDNVNPSPSATWLLSRLDESSGTNSRLPKIFGRWSQYQLAKKDSIYKLVQDQQNNLNINLRKAFWHRPLAKVSYTALALTYGGSLLVKSQQKRKYEIAQGDEARVYSIGGLFLVGALSRLVKTNFLGISHDRWDAVIFPATLGFWITDNKNGDGINLFGTIKKRITLPEDIKDPPPLPTKP